MLRQQPVNIRFISTLTAEDEEVTSAPGILRAVSAPGRDVPDPFRRSAGYRRWPDLPRRQLPPRARPAGFYGAGNAPRVADRVVAPVSDNLLRPAAPLRCGAGRQVVSSGLMDSGAPPCGRARRGVVAVGLAILAFSLVPATASAQTADNVLLVINDASPASGQIGEYYARKRAVAPDHVVHLTVNAKAPGAETIARVDYDRAIEAPIASALTKGSLPAGQGPVSGSHQGHSTAHRGHRGPPGHDRQRRLRADPPLPKNAG